MRIIHRHIKPFVAPTQFAGRLIQCPKGRIEIIVLAEQHHVAIEHWRHSGSPFKDEKRGRKLFLPEILAGLRVDRHQPKRAEIEVNPVSVRRRSRTGLAIGRMDLRERPGRPIALPQFLTGRAIKSEEAYRFRRSHAARKHPSGGDDRATHPVTHVRRPANILCRRELDG